MASSQHYSLRWNNYISHVTSCFENLRNQNDLVDVTLCCGKKRIQAHKILLSACSNYFKEIFQENKHPHPIIIFKFISYDDLLAIIEFMYKGEVSVQQDALQSFLQAAELLEVQGLTAEEKKFKDDDANLELPIVKSVATFRKVTPLHASNVEFIEDTSSTIPVSKIPRESYQLAIESTKLHQNLMKCTKEVYITNKDIRYDQNEIAVNVTGFENQPVENPSNAVLNNCNDSQNIAPNDSGTTQIQTQTSQMQTDCENLLETHIVEEEVMDVVKEDVLEPLKTTTADLDHSNSSKWTECQFCKMVITTVNLWRHIRTQHTPQPPKKCDICNKNFKNKYSLREHIRISHEQQKYTKYKD